MEQILKLLKIARAIRAFSQYKLITQKMNYEIRFQTFYSLQDIEE